MPGVRRSDTDGRFDFLDGIISYLGPPDPESPGELAARHRVEFVGPPIPVRLGLV